MQPFAIVNSSLDDKVRSHKQRHLAADGDDNFLRAHRQVGEPDRADLRIIPAQTRLVTMA